MVIVSHRVFAESKTASVQSWHVARLQLHRLFLHISCSTTVTSSQLSLLETSCAAAQLGQGQRPIGGSHRRSPPPSASLGRVEHQALLRAGHGMAVGAHGVGQDAHPCSALCIVERFADQDTYHDGLSSKPVAPVLPVSGRRSELELR